VVAVARRADRLAELVEAAGSGPGSIQAVAGDVTRADDGARLAAEVAGAPMEAVVYAAGVASLRRLAEMTSADWDRILTTNVVGFNQLLSALVPGGLAPAAVVAVLSSEVVGRPRHGLAGYAVSKAALEESILGWRLEQPALRFCRVRVGATQPTDFGAEFEADLLGPILEDWISHGLLPSAFMATDELAAVLAGVVGYMVAFEGITVEELLLRPSAPPLADVADLGADPHPDRPGAS
jgi:NAD(P)-dependent dehydrogenase (short-subunit alcohol dehydrogenase family)